MEHYRDNLRHVVRPDNPTEREASNSVQLHHYEALYLRGALTDYAAYGAANDSEEAIALSYVEYIDKVVHDERRTTIILYAHTDRAIEVLREAMDQRPYVIDNLHDRVSDTVDDL